MNDATGGAHGDVRQLLLKTKVKDLGALSGSSCVQLLDTDTVERSLKVLSENRILSAPVVAPVEDGQTQPNAWPAQLDNTDIMGFVCVNDILTSFLECYASEFGGPAFVDAAGERLSAGGALPPPPGTAEYGTCANGGGGGAASYGSGGGGGMLSRMRRLEELGSKFAQQQLRHLSCKGCDGDFLHSRHAGEATLLELIYYGFLDPKRRGMHEGEQQVPVVHRVALFDNSGAIVSVISQSDIVRFLSGRLPELGPLSAATCAQLGWDRKPVVSCTPETPALDAMRLMVECGVSSLAVVASSCKPEHGHATHGSHGQGLTHGSHGSHCHSHSRSQAPAGVAEAAEKEAQEEEEEEAGPGPGSEAAGRLLGNFSASEMRTMTAEHFGALSLPVGEFLAMEHDTEYVAANRQRLLEEGVLGSPAHEFIRDRLRRARPHAPGENVGQRLIVARSGSTFGEVVDLLVRHKIHRVYVVDEREAPVGIVTCTDILRKVVDVATAAAPPSPQSAAARS